MASASLAPIAMFPSHLKASTNLHRLASSLPSSPCSSPQRRHHDWFNLSTGKHARELAETEAAKWRIRVSFFPPFLKKKSREDLKKELMKAIAPLDRGSESSFEDQERVDQVTADLVPLNSRRVAVRFDRFKIGGLIPIKAPERAAGELEITYLDEEIRVSRGDKGNLFILKMVDPAYRVPN